MAVFCKYPTAGKVKTRLGKSVGQEKAAEIYLGLLGFFFSKVLSRLDRNHFSVYWLCDPGTPQKEYEGIFVNSFPILMQTGSNLGERLLAASQTLLKTHPRVILTGSDCIELTTEIFSLAHQSLGKKDVWIGPTLDGGYYALGLRQGSAFLFENIPWSTSEVFEKTVSRIKGAGQSYDVGPTLNDIDTAEDWEKAKDLWKEILATAPEFKTS